MEQKRADIAEFFAPDGVVVIGRLDRTRPAAEVLRELRTRYGTDRVFLVNPAGGTLGGIPVYRSALELPEPVDLAVISTPPAITADVVAECGKRGVRYALVFTSGFAEVGGAGAAHERRLAAAGREHGVRIIGPNTNTNAFEAIPVPPGLPGGKIGLLTQSGHQGRPIVQAAHTGVAFSRWVPTGNEVDLDVADFMEYFAHDPDTQVIAGYFEGFRNPDRLRAALHAAGEAGKPVIALKIGGSAAGERMAASHTGHLTGSDAVVDGLFAQHAVTRVGDLDELVDTAALFAKLPRTASGTRVGLYSMSGGSCALMSEIADLAGLEIPELAEPTQRALRALLPSYLTVANPVDNGGTFLFTSPQSDRLRVLELIAADPNVDLLVVGVTGAVGTMSDNMAADLRAFAADAPCPVVATWNSSKVDEPGFDDLVAAGIPLFRSFRNCFGALRAWRDYHRRRPDLRVRHTDPAPLSAASDTALGRGGVLPPFSARDLLAAAGIPLVAEDLAANADRAAALAESAPGPVVLKVASADFQHKSDFGLVETGVRDGTAARAAFGEIMSRAREANANAAIDGVLVQQQITGGVEMIVGAIRDPVLGHAVLVGFGGIFAEILRDTAVRPLPLDVRDATEMIQSLAGYPLLTGNRGRPEADVAALAEVIMAVARLAAAAGDRLLELDLNPVIVLPSGAVTVDSLIVTAP
ncbi:acetate--CoA ligase family protein [Amycolatopsis rubida]|uniref:Acyl-CoA synthetase (NDP forming) n=1 Tax=Amycolatopsis rubida TaxID=112413 RepID=A0A1I5SI06_9PSEU|nr:acetate--CoA ligase family protein [Amycolatopsis rubida]SFP69996.1 Acyl-CoA synthetase (NDP forming) [Amycolatopsis rubida]